jgi:2'-5' RNA ligase
MRENEHVYLFAALVPPREILDEIWAVAEEVTTIEAETPSQPQPPGRRKARRRRRDREPEPVAVAVPAPVLDVAPVAHVQLTIAKFGNLTHNDAQKLVDSMARAAAEWFSPRLRLSGYSSPESEQDPSVWVDLVGDLDALHSMVRGVHDVAKGLRLFVDRRVFQPRVRLGSVRPDATESQLEDLLARLEHLETSAWWQTSFGLLTPVEHGLALPSHKVHADIPLGPCVAH